jgi:hypothetical protein
MFPSDEQFGQWAAKVGLSQVATHEVTRDERAAAMWAAKDLDRFNEVREAYPRVRTVRGLHAKWKEEEAKRKAEEEANKKADDDEDDVVDNDDTSEGIEDDDASNDDDSSFDDEDEAEDDEPSPKKERKLKVPDYNIQEAMGAIKGIASLYGKEWEGTDEEAASVLISELLKGCETNDVGMSIARDFVKWFLKMKKVLDIAEPELEQFLKEEPKLKIVK